MPQDNSMQAARKRLENAQLTLVGARDAGAESSTVAQLQTEVDDAASKLQMLRGATDPATQTRVAVQAPVSYVPQQQAPMSYVSQQQQAPMPYFPQQQQQPQQPVVIISGGAPGMSGPTLPSEAFNSAKSAANCSIALGLTFFVAAILSFVSLAQIWISYGHRSSFYLGIGPSTVESCGTGLYNGCITIFGVYVWVQVVVLALMACAGIFALWASLAACITYCHGKRILASDQAGTRAEAGCCMRCCGNAGCVIGMSVPSVILCAAGIAVGLGYTKIVFMSTIAPVPDTGPGGILAIVALLILFASSIIGCVAQCKFGVNRRFEGARTCECCRRKGSTGGNLLTSTSGGSSAGGISINVGNPLQSSTGYASPYDNSFNAVNGMAQGHPPVGRGYQSMRTLMNGAGTGNGLMSSSPPPHMMQMQMGAQPQPQPPNSINVGMAYRPTGLMAPPMPYGYNGAAKTGANGMNGSNNMAMAPTYTQAHQQQQMLPTYANQHQY